MAPNARIDEIGREAWTTNNAKARLDEMGREAWITHNAIARLDMLGREAWIPVGGGGVAPTAAQPQICVIS